MKYQNIFPHIFCIVKKICFVSSIMYGKESGLFIIFKIGFSQPNQIFNKKNKQQNSFN